jgi:Transcription factor WhiB
MPEDAVHPLVQSWLTPQPWAALALCAACPVRNPCLVEAITRPERSGIWGGFTPLERDVLVLEGWTPTSPLPDMTPDTRAWTPVRTVARLLSISPRTIHAWAQAREISARLTTVPTGQPARLVNLEEVRARMARAQAARFHATRRMTA